MTEYHCSGGAIVDPTRLTQLEEYVKQARQSGLLYDQVRSTLVQTGWTEDEVNEYLPKAWADTEPAPAAAPVVAAPVVAPPVAPPVTPMVAPTYGTPSAFTTAPVSAPQQPVDGIGAWLSQGWTMVASDIGTMILAMLVVGLISAVTIGICGPPLSIGFYRMLLKKYDGHPIQVGDVFEGFQLFGAAWGLALITFAAVVAGLIGIGIPVAILSAIASHGGDSAQGLVGLLTNVLGTALGLFVATVMLFAGPWIADGRGGSIDATKASIEAVKANFWMYLLAVLVAQIIASAGVIVCGVGVLFTAPIGQAMLISIYRSRFQAGK